MGIERKNLFGSTVTMPGRASLSLTVIDFETPTRSSKEIDDTDIASTVNRTISGKTVDEGELSMTVRFVPGSTDPYELLPHDDELIRVTFPLATGQSVAAKWEFTGHVTKVSGVKGSTDGRTTRSITIKANTKPVFTEGA